MRGFVSQSKRSFLNIVTNGNSTKNRLSLSCLNANCIVPQYGFSSIIIKASDADNGKIVTQQKYVKDVKVRTKKIDRLNFTPHEYWITQGQGMERPFTGDKWFEKDVGCYHCTVCEKKLFTWDHKYQSPTGMATFWNHEKHAVQFLDTSANFTESSVNSQINTNANNSERKRAICSGCHSHLGLLYFDGPPPTFKRFSINSAALKFRRQEDWESPRFFQRKRKLQKFTEQEEESRKRAVLKQQQDVSFDELPSSSSSSR